jgi:hypothetical protein
MKRRSSLAIGITTAVASITLLAVAQLHAIRSERSGPKLSLIEVHSVSVRLPALYGFAALVGSLLFIIGIYFLAFGLTTRRN